MNFFLAKMERKYGKYAISNLTKYILFGYCIGYVLQLLGALFGFGILNVFTFDPYKIMHGQIWRIVTWLIIPPEDLSIFTFIMLFFYYWVGNSLERTWGTFKYNFYFFAGVFFTVVIVMIFYILCIYPFGYGAEKEVLGMFISAYVSTYYINLTFFLALAFLYQDIQVMLMFLLPVKMKWLAYFDIAIMLYEVFASLVKNTGIMRFVLPVVVLASMLNFILFYCNDYKKGSRGKTQFRDRQVKVQRPVNSQITKHKCAICGRTEKDNEELSFRFCSKCNGNYEYCQDHLFTHTHIQ